MQCRKAIIYFFVLLTSTLVMAKEKVPQVVEDKEYSGKQNSDWEKTQADLGTIRGKLESQEALVANLIAGKNQLNGEALALKMEELKKEYRKLETLTEEYNRLNLQYLTKFPERGVKEKRIYKRIKTKSLQAFEEDLTVQGRVNRLQNKILNQYPNANATDKKKKTKPEEKGEIENSKKSDVNEVTEQIIFKK